MCKYLVVSNKNNNFAHDIINVQLLVEEISCQYPRQDNGWLMLPGNCSQRTVWRIQL